ncbi:hypothetical protein BC941DRAFT_443613, partial [Chlamydoabsidia padenii]
MKTFCILCVAICSSSLDGMHFWSYYLNDSDTVIKVDNILHTAKVCEGLSLYGKMKNTVMTIYTRYILSHADIPTLDSPLLVSTPPSPIIAFVPSILLLLPLFLPLFLLLL